MMGKIENVCWRGYFIGRIEQVAGGYLATWLYGEPRFFREYGDAIDFLRKNS